MVGLNGGVMRAVSRLGFGILIHCTAAALHHATALPACLAKHGPLKATCRLQLAVLNPAGDFHAHQDGTLANPGFVSNSKQVVQVRLPPSSHE